MKFGIVCNTIKFITHNDDDDDDDNDDNDDDDDDDDGNDSGDDNGDDGMMMPVFACRPGHTWGELHHHPGGV